MTSARPATRYARALFDVALQEGSDLEQAAARAVRRSSRWSPATRRCRAR